MCIIPQSHNVLYVGPVMCVCKKGQRFSLACPMMPCIALVTTTCSINPVIYIIIFVQE